MKISLGTLLTIFVIIAATTTSHVKQGSCIELVKVELSGQIDKLEATNEIDHQYLKEELTEIKMSVTGNPLNNYADTDPIVRKKKAYAGTPETFIYETEN
jgi:adenine C2-methylase RlmN of 23S rRNA A2503 and tRNA A37